MSDTATCPYCNKEFEGDEEKSAVQKEGDHRARKHINSDEEIVRKERPNKTSIVDRWESKAAE